ncbi:NUDIX domain-containing protein [Paracoccus sp. Ld10]|uniref:NUDIX domain-containing protein n=1 Tax=Paracoccus sp. Ld10 TaxID=649158 RepID=UPI003862E09D
MIVIVGALAQPQLRQALCLMGTPVRVPGALTGGARAGIVRDGWPQLTAARGYVTGLAVPQTPQLDRYAAVMGLVAQTVGGMQVMGIASGSSGDHAPVDDHDGIAAEIALQILQAPVETDAALLAWRLPMMGTWAASRVRARAMAPSGQGIVPLRPADSLRTLQRSQPFLGFFGVERQVLTHALHQGGQTADITREAFLSGDAAVMLPWDPVRDRVLVIEQFRMAPALRGDPQPWLLEPIAGRIDAGETPEAAILREAQEEAGLTVKRLFAAFHAYPSPGALCEFLYHYVGIADLPDGCAGIHGLDAEAEDIRGHLLDRARLSALVDAGQVANGPLATLSLWLDARADRMLAQLQAAGRGCPSNPGAYR